MTEKASPTVLIDNERTVVTKWHFTRGAATGWHRHKMDYVVVPLMDGKIMIVSQDGEETIVEMRAGTPYYRETGVEHDVINAGEGEYAFLEVEFKP